MCPAVGDGVDPRRGLLQWHGQHLRRLRTRCLPGRGGGGPPVPPGPAGLPQVRSEVRRWTEGRPPKVINERTPGTAGINGLVGLSPPCYNKHEKIITFMKI